MKKETEDKIKRSLKKIEDAKKNIEDFKDIKDKFYSKINEYRDPTKIVEDLYEKVKDVDFSDIENKIQRAKREKIYDRKIQESYTVTLDSYSKFPFKIQVNLCKGKEIV